MKTFQGKTALITGGSSGIGLAMAKKFAALGANICLLARDEAKLSAACDQVSSSKANPAQKVHFLIADVSNKDQVDSVLSAYIQNEGTPDILVNSAGITFPGVFTEMDHNIHRDNMEVNYFGSLYPTIAVVPGMVQRKSGCIIFISSLVGIHGLYGYAAYSPSKFALRGLADVLRYELKPDGIDIHVAFPSDTQTPQLDFENRHKPPILKALSESNTKVETADFVADRIIKDVVKGRYMIFPTPDGKTWFMVYNLLPGNLMYRMVDFLMVNARKKAAQDLAGK
jgi:3-dehydrosphinganine reductase